MKVIIVGGGIGGLALAAGLRRRDVEVRVFERDDNPAVTEGYHITLDPRAQSALAELLDPRDYEKVLASAAAGRLRGDDVFWDWRGRVIGRATDRRDPGIDIDRITLRVILAEAAGDALVLGKTFVGFERHEGETVTARFDDGSSVTGNLLVGADGTHSTVVKQLLGSASNRPTGLLGVSGRTRAVRLPASTQRRLGVRSGFALGPGGLALYVGYLDPVGQAVLDRPDLRAAVTTEPTYIWGAMFPESERTRSWRHKQGAELLQGALDLMRAGGWSERMLEVMAESEPEGVAAFRFHAASTDARALAPWPAGRVTALGDAVHATPPTAGMGAGVAIRDAADLTRQLGRVREGEKTLAVGVREFETEMGLRGSEALTLALKTVDLIKATHTGVGSVASRVVLPVLAACTTWFRGGSGER